MLTGYTPYPWGVGMEVRIVTLLLVFPFPSGSVVHVPGFHPINLLPAPESALLSHLATHPLSFRPQGLQTTQLPLAPTQHL